MTRAAEVEVFGRLGSYEYWNKYHSYTYDVYYEGLSRPKIGARNGGFFSGYISPLIRYQTSGYAWGKALLENRHFLVNFNAELYRRTAEDAATPNMEDRLIEIGAAVQPRVEGQAFARWYRRQGILRTDPGSGYFLYHRVNQWTVDYFYRDDTGRETMQTGKDVTWSVYDHLNRRLDQGSGKTSAAGWFDFQPVLPDGYRGRVKVVLSSDSPLGEVSDISFRYAGSESGGFGIIRGVNRGTLTITPLAHRLAAVLLNVTNGGFCAPTLGRFRGRFEAVFVNKDGQVLRVKFNKDRSNYFLKIP
jgi:hypothetical protein